MTAESSSHFPTQQNRSKTVESEKQGIIETYKLFARIDRDLDGYIDVADLIVYATSLGQSWTEQEASSILELIDNDKNGLISFDELLEWYTSGAHTCSDDGAARLDPGTWRHRAQRTATSELPAAALAAAAIPGVPPSASPPVSLTTTLDAIVSSLFPVHVLHSLMRGERVRPERKEEVTVFFSDVVGFTELAAAAAAAAAAADGDAGFDAGEVEAVSDLLDRLFARLDKLADRMGVRKIETIGDAYLCATNLAGDQPACHAARMARFARAARAAAARTPLSPADPARGCVRLRIGLASGPCVATVVGRRHPKYTLYGDTVNTASRMEAAALPGRIQCTARTAALIRRQDPRIALAPRGPVLIKGKGTMETHWIL
jgi:class 3 adenylate cyclase